MKVLGLAGLPGIRAPLLPQYLQGKEGRHSGTIYHNICIVADEDIEIILLEEDSFLSHLTSAIPQIICTSHFLIHPAISDRYAGKYCKQ